MSGAAPDPASGPALEPADASVRKRRLYWVWLVPLASLAVGGWLLWSTLARQGPLIHVTFETAEGLQAGQSLVKYKDVQMGTVESFDLTPEHKVVMGVRMNSKAEPLLTEGAQFWVVKPRVFAGDITGLNTLLSGSYMDMQAGEPRKSPRRAFTGLENPPPLDPGTRGRQFHLTAPRLGSLSLGSPVFYRDVEVGKIVGWTLTGMAENVELTINILAPYDQWVHDDSRFWNTSGVTLKLGANGVQLEFDSLKALLLGAITFETPDAGPGKQGTASADGHNFALYPKEELADAAMARNRAVLATYLTGTVGELAPGAPVMLLGMRVGDVTAVELQYDTDTGKSRVRAEYVVEIDKVHMVGSKPAPHFPDAWRTLVAAGLRTSLKGGNLLTGQKQLAMEHETDARPAELGQEGDVLIIPSSGAGGGGLDELSSTATRLLAKVEKIPFEEIGRNLNGTLAGAGALVNGPQVKQALDRLNGTLGAAQELVRHLDAGTAPALRRLPAIAAELQDALAQVRSLATSVSAGSGGDGKFGRDLDRVLTQATEAVQSVRSVADLLSRHPEALIRGRVTRGVE